MLASIIIVFQEVLLKLSLDMSCEGVLSMHFYWSLDVFRCLFQDALLFVFRCVQGAFTQCLQMSLGCSVMTSLYLALGSISASVFYTMADATDEQAEENDYMRVCPDPRQWLEICFNFTVGVFSFFVFCPPPPTPPTYLQVMSLKS